MEKSDELPAKIEMLVKMIEAQKQSSVAMINAELAKQSGDLVTAKTCYQNQIAWGMKHLDVALLLNEHHSLPIEIGPIVQLLVNAMLMQADVLQSLGNLEEANVERVKAVQLSDAHLYTSERVETKRSLASSFTSQGRFNEALVTLENCRDWLIEQHDPVSVIRITIDMVDILNWLGDYTRSLDELNRAAELLQTVAEDRALGEVSLENAFIRLLEDIAKGRVDSKGIQDEASLYRSSIEICFYRALVYKALNRYEEAEEIFKFVLPEYEKLGAGIGIHFHLAAISAARGEHRQALACCQSLEPEFAYGTFLRPKLSSLLKLKAEALHCLGSTEEALKHVEAGIKDLSSTYYDPDILWRLYLLKGRILNETGEHEKALEAFVHGADVVNRLRRAPLGYRLDSTYLKDKIPLFREAIALATALDRGEECCNLMEMVKSRILTATLGIPQHKETGNKGVDKLRRRLDQLTTELDALEYKASHQSQSVRETREKAESILKERDQLLQRIRFSDPRWRSVTEPVPFDFNTIKDLAKTQGTSLLSMFYGKDKIDFVLIAGEECVTSNLVLTEKAKESLDVYLTNLKSPDSRFNPVLNDPSSVALGAKHLIPEILLEKGLLSKRLILVPHGPLHLLPWAGLVYKGKRLFEYCSISILPNLSTFLPLSKTLCSTPKIAIIGPPDYTDFTGFAPLPGAAKECEDIKKLYPENCLIGEFATGKGSTEQAFWDLAKQPESAGGILHVACHGVSDPLEPMHSGLMLADGRLDASEIALGSMQFSEVILSGCSTGWRPIEVQDIELTGDDILGLPGAFLEAGVNSVLVSIPLADDLACSKFMIRYHAHRSKGMSPMDSMQTTQKQMLDDPLLHPFQWIGLTLYGCR